ncbi:MAG: apolipoprotein N-acyltransferase [Deltaproteobacteria bacterium]|jgi:apolipoprotein N-acyltransferase|nr:apolipoprotein N-acyltransferase [Deltaproteobacteria bacterium]
MKAKTAEIRQPLSFLGLIREKSRARKSSPRAGWPSETKEAVPDASSEAAPQESSADPPLKPPAATVLAAVGGLAQTLAWPRFDLWPLTFLCLIPLWLAIKGQKPGRAFFLGWIYGLALGLTSFYWLGEVMSGYGGLGPFAGNVILVLLAAFLALYQAIWALLMARFSDRLPPLDARLAATPLLGAALWAGLDYLKNTIFTGFNWTPLAGGLAGDLRMLAAADLVGVYGLTLPTAMASLLLAEAIRLRRNFKAALASAVSGLLIIIALFLYGHERLKDFSPPSPAGESKTIAVLQPSVPQNQKWAPAFREEILGRFENLLRLAEQSRPWLTVWPETAVPFIYALDLPETLWLDDLIRQNRLAMLVGLASADYDDEGYVRLQNKAWLLEGSKTLGSYGKSHLVPFGEYVPLADDLPFLKWPFAQGLLGAAGSYSPGEAGPPLVYQDVQIGLMICFESIFPQMAREKVGDGANLLIVTTNDAWFGLSMAPDQHLAQSVMRSVENRRPLIRAANNGISALIDPAGRILNRSEQNEIRTFVWSLPWPTPTEKTLFVRGGGRLAEICGLFAAIYALARFFGRFFRPKTPPQKA